MSMLQGVWNGWSDSIPFVLFFLLVLCTRPSQLRGTRGSRGENDSCFVLFQTLMHPVVKILSSVNGITGLLLTSLGVTSTKEKWSWSMLVLDPPREQSCTATYSLHTNSLARLATLIKLWLKSEHPSSFWSSSFKGCYVVSLCYRVVVTLRGPLVKVYKKEQQRNLLQTSCNLAMG